MLALDEALQDWSHSRQTREHLDHQRNHITNSTLQPSPPVLRLTREAIMVRRARMQPLQRSYYGAGNASEGQMA